MWGVPALEFKHTQIRADDTIAPEQGNPPGCGEIGAKGDLRAPFTAKYHHGDSKD